MWRSPRRPVWPVLGIYQVPKSPRIPSNHAGGRDPAHCDASRISAGVQFISSAAARPNHAKHIPNLPIRAKSCKAFPRSAHDLSKTSKSSQIPSKTLPKPDQILPKSFQIPPKITQNRSRRPLRAHLGPMLEKSLILNAQKTPKRRPKAPRRGPRAPPNPPK